MPSYLRPWVMKLGLREQGTLLTGMRGCDQAPKNPQDSIERQLTAYLRWLIGVPFDRREVDSFGAFMRSRPPDREWKPSELEHYPLHWYVHLMHAYQVCGYRHPDPSHAESCLHIYVKLVDALHLVPESNRDMTARLNEDRIALGTVVPKGKG